jgi:acetylornithine deacetylase/succinyl-diaminopimelate desuccinylase-like protein
VFFDALRVKIRDEGLVRNKAVYIALGVQADGTKDIHGGTIPVVNLIQDALKIPVVLMGFGLPDDRIHGPNEKIHLPNFFKGVETSIRFLAEMGALPAASSGRASSRLGSGSKALLAKHEERV